MSQKQPIRQILQSHLQGNLSRRTFLKKLSALLALQGAALLLPGCSSETEESATTGNGLDSGDTADILDVVIVGGGISGLTAAYLLSDQNMLLLEKEVPAGGRISAGEWEGFHYPRGMEYIGEPEGDIAEWFDDLGLTPISIPPPTGAIAYQGEIYTGKDILDFLPSAAAEADYFRLQEALIELNNQGIEDALFDEITDLAEFAELDKLTVAQWMNDNGIHPLVQQVVDIENRGLFGAANSDLSFLFNIPEMAWNLYDPEEADEDESESYTFPRGMIELVEALMDELEDQALTGAEVTAVTLNEDETVSITYHRQGETKTVRAWSVIMATPAPITAALTPNSLNPAIRQALNAVIYAPYITLNLHLSQRVWHESWSIASLDDSFVTLYDSVRTQVDADYTEKGILGVYIAAAQAQDRQLLSQSDANILETTLRDLEKYKPDIRDYVESYDVKRFTYGFPVFNPGYLEILDTLYESPGTPGPIFLAGDYLVYATFEGAVISALNASELVTDYLATS